WPTSKIKQHHRSPPVPLPPLNPTRRKRKKRRIPGRNRPILRHPRWSTTPSRDSRNAEDRLFRPSKSSSPQITKSTPKGRPFIKKYLKGAVASGSLVQTKGKGASGSFKLASSTSGGAKVASASDKRKPASSAASKTKKSSAKRTAVATTSDKASSKTAKNKPPQSEEDCCRKEERRRCLRRRSESQEIGRLLGRKEN
ncbi:unnamed protein product, partial [Tenebrio molitor]